MRRTRRWDNLGERSFSPMLQNSQGSSIEALIRSASRRRHGLLVLEQLSYALTMVLSGAILLLLLGTQLLNWYWLILLALGGLAIGAVRLRGRLLPHYQIAQIVDQRLQLSDTLSTAWFILTTPSFYNSQRQLQIRQAEELTMSVQPQAAFPFTGKRPWALTALLLAIACGLFGVRYFAQDKLAFQRSLLPIRFSNSIEQLEARLLTQSRRSQEARTPTRRDQHTGTEERSLHEGNPDGKDNAMTGREAGNSADRANDSRYNQQSNGQAKGTGRENDGKSKIQSSNNDPNQSASPTPKGQQQHAPVNNAANKNGHEQTPKGSSEEPSLTSKMRDALSGLLAKMQGGSRPQPPGGEANQPPNPKGGRNQSASSTSQQSTSENTSDKPADASSLQAQQQAHSAENPSSSRSKGSGDSSGHRSSDTHSAAGHQDGSKDAREAEQLKAMGKLAEIIGKRSANLTGEMTVETPSGKQQLQTDYSYKTGRHSGMGSEIDHTAVPIEDQQYVREYMKQVHNQPDAR